MYWLSRYLERAENTARIIGVNTNLLLDLPGGIAPGLAAAGRHLRQPRGVRQAVRSQGRRVAKNATSSPSWSPTSPTPDRSARRMHSARENARTLREILPTEAWELLNEFFTECMKDVSGAINKRTRFEFLKRIVITLQTIDGMLDGTHEPQRRVHLQPAGAQPGTRRHDQPHRGRTLRAAAARRDARTASLRERAVDERAEEPLRLPDVPPAHAHPRPAHRRAPVPAARRPVSALLPVLPHAARTLCCTNCRAARVYSKSCRRPRASSNARRSPPWTSRACTSSSTGCSCTSTTCTT